MAEAAVAGFGARPRDVDDVFKFGVDFSAGGNSFDGVDARESLSLPVAFSGFFGFVTAIQMERKQLKSINILSVVRKMPSTYFPYYLCR